MLVKSTRFNTFFPKINNLRRRIFDLEQRLENYFVVPFSLLPIPDDAPEEIPRITASSHSGHSSFNMSVNNAQVVTNYDEEFEQDWGRCLGYFKERIQGVYSILDSFVEGKKYLYTGITTDILIDAFPESSPVELIENRFLHLKSSLEPFDLNYKITFVVENTYYVNITITNVRIYEGTITSGNVSLANLNEKGHVLGLNIDINDRYGFNFNKNHVSSYESVLKLFEITNDIVTNKIGKMIDEGVFEL